MLRRRRRQGSAGDAYRQPRPGRPGGDPPGRRHGRTAGRRPERARRRETSGERDPGALRPVGHPPAQRRCLSPVRPRGTGRRHPGTDPGGEPKKLLPADPGRPSRPAPQRGRARPGDLLGDRPAHGDPWALALCGEQGRGQRFHPRRRAGAGRRRHHRQRRRARPGRDSGAGQPRRRRRAGRAHPPGVSASRWTSPTPCSSSPPTRRATSPGRPWLWMAARCCRKTAGWPEAASVRPLLQRERLPTYPANTSAGSGRALALSHGQGPTICRAIIESPCKMDE